MVRVRPEAVLAATQSFDTIVEVIEGDGEMAMVASGRFQHEARLLEHAYLNENEDLEADQRRLLGDLGIAALTARRST
jgi:hypothetical protein